jgi:hypothetical protein
MGTEPDEDRSPDSVLNRIRANPTSHLAFKIAIGLVGAVVIALGIILIPFPGPAGRSSSSAWPSGRSSSPGRKGPSIM